MTPSALFSGRGWAPALRRAALIASAAALEACSGDAQTPQYSVSIDPSFTTDQADAVSAALDDWRSAVPQLRIEAAIASCSMDADHHVCFRPAAGAPDPSSGDVIGETTPVDAADAVVDLFMARIQAMGLDLHELTEQTAAHEMGHAMGLQHSSAGQLMAPTVADQAHTVTPADVAQFWAVRGI